MRSYIFYNTLGRSVQGFRKYSAEHQHFDILLAKTSYCGSTEISGFDYSHGQNI